MANGNVKAKVIGVLQKREALAGGSIAWTIKEDSHITREAIEELIDEGSVVKHEDGFRYKLADGYTPPGGNAA